MVLYSWWKPQTCKARLLWIVRWSARSVLVCCFSLFLSRNCTSVHGVMVFRSRLHSMDRMVSTNEMVVLMMVMMTAATATTMMMMMTMWMMMVELHDEKPRSIVQFTRNTLMLCLFKMQAHLRYDSDEGNNNYTSTETELLRSVKRVRPGQIFGIVLYRIFVFLSLFVSLFLSIRNKTKQNVSSQSIKYCWLLFCTPII